MRMNKKKEIVPKLRFPEYIGNKLKITKLGKISSIVKEKAGENKYTLMSVTSGVGLVPQEEKFGREIAGDSYKTYIVIKKYDFAYNKSATKQFPEGYISMLGEYDIAAVPNSIFTCFRITDSESYPPFFDYLWHNNYHGHWLRKYIEVGARAHGALSVDTKHLWSMPLVLPDFKEQQKIADCLSSIDELIDAESRKLKALEKYKKGLMQKLFPEEGKTLPEWRFPEFQECGEWQKSTIAEVTSYVDYRGKTPVKSKEGVFLITAKNIKMGYIDYNVSKEYIPKDQYLEVMSRGIPQLGDVLITTEAPCGNVAQIDKVDVALAQRVIKYRGDKNKINNTFLKYVFLSPVFQSELKKNSTGGIVGGIKGSVLHQMSIKFPDDIIEQQKIADCLSEIDTMIKVQSNKVERLKSHKKGLMQGLFPSLEEADV